MKSLTFFCFLLLVVLFACKEEAKKMPEEAKTAAPAPEPRDTAVGIEGADKAKFDGIALTYPAAKIKVTDSTSSQIIEINGTKLPSREGDFFSGVYKNFLLIDNGTGPNGRKLMVWSIAENKLVFETPYEGDLSIKDEKLNFIKPIDLKKTKLPKPVVCPDAENWKKDGLQVGYGIPSAYGFTTKAVSETGAATCFAVQ